MENNSLPDDADFLAAAAVGALAIAHVAASKIKGDEMLAAWVREIGELPSWREDPESWRKGLHTLCEKYRLPSQGELANRTIEQSLFNRVRGASLDAVMSSDPRARHFHLSMASIAAGSLLSLSVGANSQASIDAAIETAFASTGSQGGKKGNESRNKLKGDAFAFLTREFPEIPLHRKGAPKGKPDAPKLAAALHKNPATSHLPEKTRSDWAKEWAKTRKASQ